ncbi:MAG: hypothetical protein J6D52_07100 [Clostridia bacterium]|nr:hypothetical protein [Clostridia bacterium]
MLKKIFTVFMSVIFMCCSMNLLANAESYAALEDYIIDSSINGNEIQPYYSYTSSIKATLSDLNGKAVCTGNVTGYNGTTTKIKITMTLQKKTLLWWSEVEEWTTTVSSYKTTLEKTATVDSGKHRVKVEAIVYSGSDSETITVYSSTVEF